MLRPRKKIITLGDKKQEVIFRKVKSAKAMRITLAPGRITVTGPFFVPFFALEKFWDSKQDWVKAQATFLAAPERQKSMTKERFLAVRRSAATVVEKKLNQWNSIYNFKWNRVTIRNQKTRFGSCSAKKNLSFHACIVDLPEALQDYLVVHELCHLQEMNHGPRFWALVERAIPEPRLRAKALACWNKSEQGK